MKQKMKYIIGILVIVCGFGGQIAYDFYLTPYVFSGTVVKARVEQDFLPKNYMLTADDLYVDQVARGDIPKDAVVRIEDVLNKQLVLNVPDGQILTKHMVDSESLEPGLNESIFPIPKQIIFAINGSLRSKDKVDILLIKERYGYEDEVLYEQMSPEPFLEGIHVVHVRTDENNDVLDTDTGNINMRSTSTGRVSSAEVKLQKEQREMLINKIEEGFKLWIVRVE